jgi:hypothetical protein
MRLPAASKKKEPVMAPRYSAGMPNRVCIQNTASDGITCQQQQQQQQRQQTRHT